MHGLGSSDPNPLWFELTEALALQVCACGVAHDDQPDTCPVSLSQPMTQEAVRQTPSKTGKAPKGNRQAGGEIMPPDVQQSSSTLIEFPGSTRALPEWRKQLSQRVREVQERKAREAAEELAAAQEAGLVSLALPSGQLELVPDLEQPAMNPIVSKALERIDRARRNEVATSRYTATAAAAAYAPARDLFTEAEAAPIVETKPRLTVVAAPPKITEPEVVPEEASLPLAIEPPIETIVDVVAEVVSPPELVTEIAAPRSEHKPVRVISDNDPCLSYLETCLGVPALADDTRTDIAGLWRRSIAGIFDLVLVAIMVSPAAAAIQYSGSHWADTRVIGFMSSIAAVTMFAYFTITTAMTGRTLAMRMFSLRTIDLRTGLIPTGGQSIKRALGHVLSLALAGLGLAYAIIDPDHRTVHDRFSHTIVIRG